MRYRVNKIQRTYTTFLKTVGWPYRIEFKNLVFLGGNAFEVCNDACEIGSFLLQLHELLAFRFFEGMI